MKMLKTVMVWYLVGARFIITTVPRCFAGFSSSEAIALSLADRPADLEKRQRFLETKMVGERLKDLGFAPEEVRMKVADLDVRQIHQLALHLDEMQVAGDGGEVVIIVFLAAILVVLILYAKGHRILIK